LGRNRQFAYNFIFNNPDVADYKNYIVTDIMGEGQIYCKEYLDKNTCNKIQYLNFDFTKDESKNNNVYAGFLGNFIGKKYDNKFSENWKSMIESRGFEILSTYDLDDNIANEYGTKLIITRKR